MTKKEALKTLSRVNRRAYFKILLQEALLRMEKEEQMKASAETRK